MEKTWSAEIASDPTREFDLVVELSEGMEHRVTIYRHPAGDLRLTIHRSDRDAEIPVAWLREVLERASQELPGAKASPG